MPSRFSLTIYPQKLILICVRRLFFLETVIFFLITGAKNIDFFPPEIFYPSNYAWQRQVRLKVFIKNLDRLIKI
jgi:hypothetical protein